jgi:hypothetical protein
MPEVILVEKKVRLRFTGQEHVKWDDHVGFQQGVQRLQHTKAVDFLVGLDDGRLGLIEVKDFRGHRIENQERIRSRELVEEVAAKVRDSLAGSFWASDREHDKGEIARLALRVSRRDTEKPIVVLWLEDDRADAATASALQQAIASSLRPFLSAKVIVTSSRLEQETGAPLAWLSPP